MRADDRADRANIDAARTQLEAESIVGTNMSIPPIEIFAVVFFAILILAFFV